MKYSIKASAEMYGVHPDTIRRRIATGQLRAFRSGRIIRVDAVDLEAMFRPIHRMPSKRVA